MVKSLEQPVACCNKELNVLINYFLLCYEIMVLFVLRKLILQTRMRSHLVGLDVWCLVRPPYFMCADSEGCAGSLEPSLAAYVISTIISWAGSIIFYCVVSLKYHTQILNTDILGDSPVSLTMSWHVVTCLHSMRLSTSGGAASTI